jgi:predicted negative regulator of RcsB-dependent stress response
LSRITRKELKSDRFALEVEHSLTYFEEHQKEIIRYAGIGLAVIALVAGYFWYSGRAISIQETPVGPLTPGASTSFPTQDVKDQVALKAFGDIQAQYPSTDEGRVAEYYIGSIQADAGKNAEAEKAFKDVADKGGDKYSSLAKLALAQIYFSTNRAPEAEALLRDLMAHPTAMVSSEQATITLARQLITRNPAEARKLLEPLRARQGAIGATAITLSGELPPQ